MADTDPVTLRRIAAESGMSVSAVSKILRNAYKANTPKGRRRVEEITALARSLGYMANGPARRLRSGRHHAIAVLAPVDRDGHPEYITFEFITGIATALASENYGLTLLTYPRFEPGVAITKLADRSVDGVLLLEQSTPELERFLEKASVPAVYVNVEPRPGLATICRDEYAAARAVMRICIGLGYRRFLVAGGWTTAGHFSHLRRAAAIADVVAAEPNVACVYNGVAGWVGGFERSIAACEPEADTLVLAMDASTALRLPNCLAAKQPLACCDESHLFDSLAPWLTRACFDRAAMGRIATANLLRHLHDASTPLGPALIESQILIGESTPSRAAAVRS